MGGAAAVIARAREDFKAGNYRCVAQIMDQVVYADPTNREARALAARAFEQLGYLSESATWRNAYLLGAQELRIGPPSPRRSPGVTPDMLHAMLAAQPGFPLVKGIRSKPVTSLSPRSMMPGGPGTMQDEAWLRGFAGLDRYGFSWDLRAPYWHLKEAADVASAFPQTPIVLNHTGFPWDRSAEG
jgi:hypothetical protein